MGEWFTSRYNLHESPWQVAVPFKTINSTTTIFILLLMSAAALAPAPGVEINSLVSLNSKDKDKLQSTLGSLAAQRWKWKRLLILACVN